MNFLIDTHCHLDRDLLKEVGFEGRGTEDEQVAAILEAAAAANVRYVINVSTSPKNMVVCAEIAEKHKNVFYTLGIHPEEEAYLNEESLDFLAGQLNKKQRPVAIGEIGLDYHYLKDHPQADRQKELQKWAFKEQIKLANQHKLPLIIHSRQAFADCMAILDAMDVDWEHIVFHCFAEGREEIKALKERGAYGSFTGIITYKNAEITRQAAIEQGLERLILETDAPFLSPVPLRGKPNQPAHLSHTASFCSNLFQSSLDQITSITTQNAISCFRLPL